MGVGGSTGGAHTVSRVIAGMSHLPRTRGAGASSRLSKKKHPPLVQSRDHRHSRASPGADTWTPPAPSANRWGEAGRNGGGSRLKCCVTTHAHSGDVSSKETPDSFVRRASDTPTRVHLREHSRVVSSTISSNNKKNVSLLSGRDIFCHLKCCLESQEECEVPARGEATFLQAHIRIFLC